MPGALIHPKVEPEICFVLERALKGPGCHIGAVLAGDRLRGARHRGDRQPLPRLQVRPEKRGGRQLTSAARFVVGGQAQWADRLDLRTLGVVMEKNGEVVAIGAGAAVLGHPAAAVAMLANHLGKRGQEIPAGTMIMSGGVTEAVAVEAGDHVSLKGRTDDQKRAVIE
jgi:2-oxo-3-hexenedioate decarboxylase